MIRDFEVQDMNGLVKLMEQHATEAGEGVGTFQEKNLIEIDNHAYFRRDIEPFKTIGGLDQVKGMKEYILDKRIEGADKDEYFLRHNGGGQFEIRKRVDLSVVYGDDNEPLIFYQKDLYKLYKDREAEGKKIIKEEALTLQEKKQKAKQEAESFEGVSP